jgi:spermidine synthase
MVTPSVTRWAHLAALAGIPEPHEVKFPTRHTLMTRRNYLLAAVFFAGMTTLALELSASRLMGNIFGTSNIVWANIIGLILIYLSAGYYLGGRWADRWPTFTAFYRLILWAAFSAGVVPLIAQPVLLRAAQAVERLNAAVMAGSFISTLVLFSVPVTLLGGVSPFAIRLAIEGKEQAGRVSGRIYALSTLGSILGTFTPVLILIPTIGTARTFMAYSFMLMLVGLIGLALHDRYLALKYVWMPIVLAALSLWIFQSQIKRGVGQIYETESAYNYIQVVEREGVRQLLLNEGQGIHSVYAEEMTATYGTWDFFLAAPFFNPPGEATKVERVGLVGLAAGTISKQYTQVFGAIPIDGWEIDPQILDVGRTYFAMNEPNLNAIAADGRWGLNHSPHQYAVIGVDAYRLPYIPWHLTTREFFSEAKEHLSEDGVIAINVGRTIDDRRIIEAMVGTLQSVFSSVHVVDVPYTFNTMVYATVRDTTPENLLANQSVLMQDQANPLLLDVIQRTIENLRPTPDSEIVFTDDWAPIERLTNSIAIRFIMFGDLASLQ